MIEGKTTLAEMERFESHRWAVKKNGVNRFQEPTYQSICTACGVTPSSPQAMAYCPDAMKDEDNGDASILDFTRARIRRR